VFALDDGDPNAIRRRRQTVEHLWGLIKVQIGTTHLLTRSLPRVTGGIALHVLAYNLTRVMNIVGCKRLIAALERPEGQDSMRN